MVRYERYLYDKDIITAILDMCPTMHVGFQDKECPYVLPMNYGYGVTEDKLLIFTHSGLEGYKLKLIEKNPLVCVNFSAWINFPDRPYKGHVHDFRSVMAFGKIRKVDLKTEPAYCKEALQALFKKNHRTGCKNPKGIMAIQMYVIECDWADISAKTEMPVRTVDDVPFLDVYNLPEDDELFDVSDLLEQRKDEIINKRYLGYLEE